MSDPIETAHPVIKATFPREVLSLPRKEFNEWRKLHGVPRYTGPMAAELFRVRRILLARKYARRKRIREISTLESQNRYLRQREKDLIEQIAVMQNLVQSLE